MFLNLLIAAEGALIRAAASTQTFGVSFLMTKFVSATCLIFLLVVANSCQRVPAGTTSPEAQVSVSKTDAPPESVAVFRSFFDYVRKPGTNLITDKPAQERWLSKLFRMSLADGVKRAGDPKGNPDYPSNSQFVGVWNYPTSYSIIGSRHYDYRNSDNPEDNRAVIDVLYEWDQNGSIDNQYPGAKALYSFVFVFEDGAWKLDDVYTFSDKYAKPGSLRGYYSRP
ncbi:MAG: hypothetical protein QOH42_918 [Blastocatellia bacterium]|nr:hypothetical protein [Blastocatellia bacterium]